jgi:Ca-activated chloride channel family protein
MDWLHPNYIWTLAAVPLVAVLFVWSARRRRVAVAKLGDRRLIEKLTSTVSARRRRWKSGLATLAVLFVTVALLGPRFGSQLREVKREGIDLIIALDVSLSMQAEDIAPNRLARSKNEIKKLLDNLRGDRVGLVLFAGDAFLQCPLTTDYGAVRLFLDVANPDLIPTPGTDFSAALRTAIRAFQGSDEDPDAVRTRAILFVSDGENHIADIDELLQQARAADIVLFAAGVGEESGAPIPVSTTRSGTNYKKDRQGRIVTTRLEEAALKSLAEEGAYFRIARTSSSLNKITAALDRLEKSDFGTEEFEEYEEKYQWPLVLGLLFLVAEMVLSDRRKPSIAEYETAESAKTK